MSAALAGILRLFPRALSRTSSRTRSRASRVWRGGNGEKFRGGVTETERARVIIIQFCSSPSPEQGRFHFCSRLHAVSNTNARTAADGYVLRHAPTGFSIYYYLSALCATCTVCRNNYCRVPALPTRAHPGEGADASRNFRTKQKKKKKSARATRTKFFRAPVE